jgi:hypothetical protein
MLVKKIKTKVWATRFRPMANFSVRVFTMAIAISLFAVSCGDDGEEDDAAGGTVTVTITNLPAGIHTMGGAVRISADKPEQWDGLSGDGLAGGSLLNGSAVLIGDVLSGGTPPWYYSGGDGYLHLQTMTGIEVQHIEYNRFIGKNRVTLKPGDNTFDFTQHFEVLHRYGGKNGIFSITGVPPITEVIRFTITDYPQPTDEDVQSLELAFNAKPLARIFIPTTDYLSMPVNSLINQQYDSNIHSWNYQDTDDRFTGSGTFFMYSEYYHSIDNEDVRLYAGQVSFSNGCATINRNGFKKIE